MCMGQCGQSLHLRWLQAPCPHTNQSACNNLQTKPNLVTFSTTCGLQSQAEPAARPKQLPLGTPHSLNGQIMCADRTRLRSSRAEVDVEGGKPRTPINLAPYPLGALQGAAKKRWCQIAWVAIFGLPERQTRGGAKLPWVPVLACPNAKPEVMPNCLGLPFPASHSAKQRVVPNCPGLPFDLPTRRTRGDAKLPRGRFLASPNAKQEGGPNCLGFPFWHPTTLNKKKPNCLGFPF